MTQVLSQNVQYVLYILDIGTSGYLPNWVSHLPNPCPPLLDSRDLCP